MYLHDTLSILKIPIQDPIKNIIMQGDKFTGHTILLTQKSNNKKQSLYEWDIQLYQPQSKTIHSLDYPQIFKNKLDNAQNIRIYNHNHKFVFQITSYIFDASIKIHDQQVIITHLNYQSEKYVLQVLQTINISKEYGTIVKQKIPSQQQKTLQVNDLSMKSDNDSSVIRLLKQIRWRQSNNPKTMLLLLQIHNLTQNKFYLKIFKTQPINNFKYSLINYFPYTSQSHSRALLVYQEVAPLSHHQPPYKIKFQMYGLDQHINQINQFHSQTIITQYEVHTDQNTQLPNQLIQSMHILPYPNFNPQQQNNGPFLLVVTRVLQVYHIIVYKQFDSVPKVIDYNLGSNYLLLDVESVIGSKNRILLIIVCEDIVTGQIMLILHHQDLNNSQTIYKKIQLINLPQNYSKYKQIKAYYSNKIGYYANIICNDKTQKQYVILQFRFIEKDVIYMKLIKEILGEHQTTALGKQIVDIIA